MDAPLPSPDALIRPWRTATLVASLVAAIELVLLVGAALLLLAKPLAHAVQRHAEASALAPATPRRRRPRSCTGGRRFSPAKHLRSHTGVFVLNGNGRNGAASAEAAKLSGMGYRVPGKTNAKRQDYATTVVMYRRGWEPRDAGSRATCTSRSSARSMGCRRARSTARSSLSCSARASSSVLVRVD